MFYSILYLVNCQLIDIELQRLNFRIDKITLFRKLIDILLNSLLNNLLRLFIKLLSFNLSFINCFRRWLTQNFSFFNVWNIASLHHNFVIGCKSLIENKSFLFYIAFSFRKVVRLGNSKLLEKRRGWNFRFRQNLLLFGRIIWIWNCILRSSSLLRYSRFLLFEIETQRRSYKLLFRSLNC